ncbi:MAG: threonine synthase [Victivallales bacterium]|nr:threonine synthase [Victivallales bacterium]
MGNSSDSSQYISTRGGISPVSFCDAVMMGLATDGGLLVPARFPKVEADTLDGWRRLGYPELAFEVMRPFVGDALPPETLRQLVQASYATFDTADVVPIKTLDGKDLYVAELYHGPTLAFKDVALQFLGNLFAEILRRRGGRLNILGATSGDTGSAAIHGVRGKAGIEIFILYPEGRVSPLQERQMATVPDPNVHCVAIEGTFDDGQRVMKQIFNDLPFKEKNHLGAVNSVNWARILAQVVYYFWGAFRVQELSGSDAPVQVCVPTGNFGDIFAGYVACRMGAPIARLLLATNENDILSRFFNTGTYAKGTVRPTLSPSMDIQVASNFERYLYYRLGEDAGRTKTLMESFEQTGTLSLDGTDGTFAAGRGDTAATLATIKKYYERHGVLLDPHGAVGVAVAEANPLAGCQTLCLETAHPGKFPAAVAQALGDGSPARHEALEKLKELPLRKVILPPTIPVIEDYIVKTLAGQA